MKKENNNLGIFDPIHSRLSGPMMIEASAGTGKTYSLMHIFLRLLVENNIPLKNILLVTFTNAATYELRSRLREILTDVSEQLSSENISLKNFSSDDETLKKQMEKWADEGRDLDSIRQAFRQALESIDDAAIFTIHSFCNRMLQDFVFSSQGHYDFQSGDGEAEKEIAVENFLRKNLPKLKNKKWFLSLAKKGGWNAPLLTLLNKLTELSEERPKEEQIEFNPISTELDPDNEAETFFFNFVKQVPEDFDKLKTKNSIFTPNDLLVVTQKKLIDNNANNSFVAKIREQYRAVLIDEFQDTDPIQYSIFKTLFLDDKKKDQRPVIFVGDPKQSIYGFRNSDLDMYFNAKEKISPEHVQALITNYRSTPGIVIAVNKIFSLYELDEPKGNASAEFTTSFLDKRLPYKEIKFDKSKPPLFQKQGDKLIPLPSFELWSNVFNSDGWSGDTDSIRNKMASYVARDIARLLDTETTYKNKRLAPNDIAILVRARKDAEVLIPKLKGLGIRTIIQSNENVLESEEADDILKVLQAMDNPTDHKLLNIARSTKIFGHSLRQIKESEEDAQKSRLAVEEAISQFESLGILAAFAHLFRENGTESQLLDLDDGERILTNYEHILELLNNEVRNVKTISGLIRWLSTEIAQGNASEDRNLRRETDNDVVRIVTIHGSKGLQYPVVYVWGFCKQEHSRKYNIYKKRTNGNQSNWVFSFEDVSEEDKTEEYQETLRLFYVAITRATARLVLPYFFRLTKSAIYKSWTRSALPHALTGVQQPEAKNICCAFCKLKEELTQNKTSKEEVIKSLKNVVSDDQLDAEVLNSYEPFRFSPQQNFDKDFGESRTKNKIHNDLLVGKSAGQQYSDWTRTSFTGLSKGIEPIEGASAVDESAAIDSEITAVQPETPRDDHDFDLLGFSKGFMKANVFGNLFHQLMEQVEFNGQNDQGVRRFCQNHSELIRITDDILKEANNENLPLPFDGLNETVKNVLEVPFPAGSFRLADVEPKRHVSEMDFLISVGKTVEGRKPFRASKLGEILEQFDPLYSGLNLSDQELKGYLNGSIDLVFEKDGKYWIVDWKTNTLSDRPSAYTKELVDHAMDSHHYRLQYLLYIVALKRYLETRLKVSNGYKLIGGAAYYFVRGIRKDKPQQAIVFDRPKNAVIECLDDFLAHGYSRKVFETYLERSKGER